MSATDVEKIVTSKFEDDELNGVVLVADGEEILYHQAHGIAHPNGEELTTDHLFNLASVSKPMIAYATLVLATRGKIDLDVDITRYLELPYKGIKTRHLLQHTSGLPDHLEAMDDQFDYDRVAENNDLLTFLQKRRPPLLFKPGSEYDYSNCAYALLGCLIEHVSENDIDAWLKENLFQPLGMQNTMAFNLAKKPQLEKRAYGIDFDEGEPELFDLTPLDGIIGDGQIYATAADVRTFALAAAEGKLLDEQHHRQLFLPGETLSGDDLDCGMGWFVEEYEENGYVYHTGSWVGFQSILYHCPEAKSSIIILENMGTEPSLLADELFEFVADDSED